MYQARQYGRDGDDYGRHALVEPGGDNVQRDVLHIVPPSIRRLHPTRFDPDYQPRHAGRVIKEAEIEDCGHNNEFLRDDGAVECFDCGKVWAEGTAR